VPLDRWASTWIVFISIVLNLCPVFLPVAAIVNHCTVTVFQTVMCCWIFLAHNMDFNSDLMQREGMQSTHGTFSSVGDVSTTPAGAQPVMATQALMPGLFAFQSLTPGSTVQPHSMSYVLPTSSQLLGDFAASTLASGSGTMLSAATNSLSTLTPVVPPGTTGVTRPPTTLPGTLVQLSSSTHANRVSFVQIWVLI